MIQSPNNWTPNCAAEDAQGICSPWDLHACRWSILGAIERVVLEAEQYRSLLELIKEIQITIGGSLLGWEQSHTHEEVRQAFIVTVNRLKEVYGRCVMSCKV